VLAKRVPVFIAGLSTSWKLGETTTPDNTWVVEVVILFSDYKSDYLHPAFIARFVYIFLVGSAILARQSGLG
jgi:hypothetical protein